MGLTDWTERLRQKRMKLTRDIKLEERRLSASGISDAEIDRIHKQELELEKLNNQMAAQSSHTHSILRQQQEAQAGDLSALRNQILQGSQPQGGWRDQAFNGQVSRLIKGPEGSEPFWPEENPDALVDSLIYLDELTSSR